MSKLSLLCNLILIVVAAMAAFNIKTEKPFILCAVVIAFFHGLIKAVYWKGAVNTDCAVVAHIMQSLVELGMVALTNIELYKGSEHSALAMLHAFSLLPLIFDIIVQLRDDEVSGPIENLKDWIILANVISMFYFAANEGNNLCYANATMVLFVRYGGMVSGGMADELESLVLAGLAHTIVASVTGEK